jgi:hypothetical protein
MSDWLAADAHLPDAVKGREKGVVIYEGTATDNFRLESKGPENPRTNQWLKKAAKRREPVGWSLRPLSSEN